LNQRSFHLVVIDEASQMTLADSYYPIRYLHPKEGRLLLAGDHEQLPPIINGKDYIT
jgi:superfamily I DNA and/or RNA helicase